MSRKSQEDHKKPQQDSKRLKRSGEEMSEIEEAPKVEEIRTSDNATEWKLPEETERRLLTEAILDDSNFQALLDPTEKTRKINQAQELLKIIYYKDCKNIDLEMISDIISNIWKKEKAEECILDALEKDIKDRSPLQKSDLELFKEKLNAQNLENFSHLDHAGHLLKGSKLPCSTQEFATRCRDLKKIINSQNDIPKVEYINLANELQKIEGIDEMENKDIAEILVNFLKDREYSFGTPKFIRAICYIIQGFEEFRTGCLKEIGQHTSTTLDYDLIADLDIEALELLVEKGFIIKNKYEALFHAFSKYYPDNNEKRINKVKFIIENGLEEDQKETYDIYKNKAESCWTPQEIEYLIPLLKLVLEHEDIENHKIKNLFKSIFCDLEDYFLHLTYDGDQKIDKNEIDEDLDENLKSIAELLFEHEIPLEDENGEMFDITPLINLGSYKTLYLVVEKYLDERDGNLLEHEDIENHTIKNLFKSILCDLEDYVLQLKKDGTQEIDKNEIDEDLDENLKSIAELLFKHGIPLEDEKGEMLDTTALGELGLRETQKLLKNPPRSVTQSQGAQALFQNSKRILSTT